MARGTKALVLALALPACSYEPMGLDGAVAGPDGAIQQHEIVAEGTSSIVFGWFDDDDQWHTDCAIESDARGWVAHVTPDDAGCSGCSEDFTLVFETTDESDCDFVVPGAATIAVAPLDWFPWEGASDYVVDRLTTFVPTGAAGPAMAFARTDWTPAGPGAFRAWLAVHDLAEGPADGFARGWLLRAWWYAGTDHGYASWEMTLNLRQ